MNTKAFRYLSYGLYIVSSKMDGKINGQIVNTVFQVCSEPPIIAVAINKDNYTHEFVCNSHAFTVSVLAQDTPLPFIGNFGFKSGRAVDKYNSVQYTIGELDIPLVQDNALAFLEVKVIDQVDVHTHTVFIGEVVNADIWKEDEPLTYAYYQQVKRGTTPKSAPSYISNK